MQCSKNEELRLKILKHYSPELRCKCGFSDIRALQIDHVNGGGTRHCKKVGTGAKFYRWIIKMNYPKGLQVLCANCNWIKKIERVELRKRNVPDLERNWKNYFEGIGGEEELNEKGREALAFKKKEIESHNNSIKFRITVDAEVNWNSIKNFDGKRQYIIFNNWKIHKTKKWLIVYGNKKSKIPIIRSNRDKPLIVDEMLKIAKDVSKLYGFEIDNTPQNIIDLKVDN